MALAVVVLSPTSEQQSGLLLELLRRAWGAGAPPALVTFARLEVAANVAMVVPAGLLAALSWPRTTWQTWTASGFLAALAVELVQGLALPEREASASDVVANTLGVLLGAGLVAAVRTVSRWRDAGESPGRSG